MKAADMTEEELRQACEARFIARMESTEQRDWYLAGVESRRSKQAAQALRVMVWDILRKMVRE